MVASLRLRTLLLAGIILLPGAVYLSHSYTERRDREIDRTRQDAVLIAGLVAERKRDLIERSRALLAGLALTAGASDSVLFGRDCAALLQRAIIESATFNQAAIVDPGGTPRCSSEPQGQRLRLDDREYFREAIRLRQFTLSEPQAAAEGGPYTVVAAQPMLDRNEGVHGVLLAAIDPKSITGALTTPIPANGSIVSLIDERGTILARHPDGEKYAGRAIPDRDAFLAAVQGAPEGVVRTNGLDAVERFIAYRRIDFANGSPLYVRVGMPTSVVQAAAAETLRSGAMAIALVVLMTVLVAWAASDRLVLRPMRRLGEAAEQLGQGDLSVRTGLPSSDTEIGRLAQRFDDLAEHLEATERARRTLSAGNRALLRATSEQELMHAMCHVAVDSGGYALALVGLARDDAEKSVEIVARAGRDDGFVDALNPTWEDNERGRATIGPAIREGKAVFLRRVRNDPRAEPWRDALLERGFGSVISLPLRLKERTFGTLTLYAREENAFDRDEVALLDEMAADLSFGVATLRERERRVAAERAAEYAATHDPVTGLSNRDAFAEQLRVEIETAQAKQQPLAVLVAHVPTLPALETAFGSNAAKHVAREIGTQVQRVADGCTTGRIAFDDFSIARAGDDAESAHARAIELMKAFESPVMLNDVEIDVRPVVGVSYFPGHGEDPDLLIRRAALAAREATRRELPFLAYRGGGDADNPERLALASELRHALSNQSLTLHVQPKITLADGRMCGVEALVRWAHPVRGNVPPNRFVPIAEQTGMIQSLTNFVLDAATRQQRTWLSGGSRTPIAVNLSARNLNDPRLVERVRGLLDTWGVPGEMLEFEITETALVEEPERAQKLLRELRELGARLYIDDFGIGYSSLSYLVTLPVHALKIDRSFVARMAKSDEARAVVASIISLAHSLHLTVVAEGVETEADAAMLRELGCDQAQGYYYARPSPAESLKLH